MGGGLLIRPTVITGIAGKTLMDIDIISKMMDMQLRTGRK